MMFAHALALGAGGRVPWSPSALGASLLGFWDAERSDLITHSSGAVSSWRDTVGGYDAVQAVSASKPTYSATSFNGRPGIYFDGVDDEFALGSVPGAFPTGSAACEIWAVLDQTALPADASLRYAFAYGGAGGNTNRGIQRDVLTGVNSARATVGNGAAQIARAPGDFSGRQVIRAVVSPTTVRCELGGAPGADAAVVATTGSARVRIGANNGTSAANFYQGGVNAVLVTSALSAAQAAQLYTYLNTRKG